MMIKDCSNKQKYNHIKKSLVRLNIAIYEKRAFLEDNHITYLISGLCKYFETSISVEDISYLYKNLNNPCFFDKLCSTNEQKEEIYAGISRC